jgi:hypothetical protein
MPALAPQQVMVRDGDKVGIVRPWTPAFAGVTGEWR